MNALICSKRVGGEVMLSFLGIPFRSQRRPSIGYALLLVRSHVACVSKPGTTRAKRTTRRMVGLRWNATVTCATCTTRWPMARQQSRRDVARHVTDHQSLSKQWLVHPNYRKKKEKGQEYSSLERKRCKEHSWAKFFVWERSVRRLDDSRP